MADFGQDHTWAFLVWGPESTGTRFCTEVLISLGCAGSAQHDQPFDKVIPSAESGRPIVWRRSFPHAGTWPEPTKIIKTVKSKGYTPYIVVTVRDLACTCRSQVSVGHVETIEQARENIIRAYSIIYPVAFLLFPTRTSVFSFDGITCAGVPALKSFVGTLPVGMQGEASVEIKRANEKYYK